MMGPPGSPPPRSRSPRIPPAPACTCGGAGVPVSVSLFPSLPPCRYHRSSISVPLPVPLSPFSGRCQCPWAVWPCRCPRAGAAVPVSRSLCPGAGPAPPAAAPRGHVRGRTCLRPGPALPRSHLPPRPRMPRPFSTIGSLPPPGADWPEGGALATPPCEAIRGTRRRAPPPSPQPMGGGPGCAARPMGVAVTPFSVT